MAKFIKINNYSIPFFDKYKLEYTIIAQNGLNYRNSIEKQFYFISIQDIKDNLKLLFERHFYIPRIEEFYDYIIENSEDIFDLEETEFNIDNWRSIYKNIEEKIDVCENCMKYNETLYISYSDHVFCKHNLEEFIFFEMELDNTRIIKIMDDQIYIHHNINKLEKLLDEVD